MTPIALLFALADPAQATIVNVFTPSVGAIEDGWHGSVSASTTVLAGNENKSGVASAAGVRVKHGAAHLSALTGSGEIAYALDEVITDKAFANLRHRWMFAEPLAAFGFAQIDHNALRALQVRDLAGLGCEVRMWRNDWTEAHLGVAIDDSGLRSEAAAFEHRVSQIVAEDSELSAYVERLGRREFAQ